MAGRGGKRQEPEQPAPVAMVPVETPGAMLRGVADEIAAMIHVARQYPRMEGRIATAAMEELEHLSSDDAAWLWYSIPYRDKCKGDACPHDPPHGTDVYHTVHVEGPSVHAAQYLAMRWGHNKHGWREIENSDERVVVEGVFMDWQNNVMTNDVKIISKSLTLRSGHVVRLSEDRLSKAVAAAGQKARRNAILAGLPRFLHTRYWMRAKEITQAPTGSTTNQKPIEDRRASAVDLFKRHGITLDVLEKHLRKPLKDWTDENLATLRGIAGAIRDGFVEPEEAFAVAAEDTAQPSQPEEAQQGTLGGLTGKAE